MGFVDTATEVVFAIFEGISEGLVYFKAIAGTILDTNYDAMTKILTFLWNLAVTTMAVVDLLVLFIYTICICVIDFVTELFHFLVGVLSLVWKLLVLLYSLLDLLFHFIECLFYFIWTGGQWTAKTIQISSRNLTENGIGTWKYFVLSVKELTDSVIGGFTAIGVLSKEIFQWTYSVLASGYEYFISAVYYIDELVRDAAVYLFDSTYHFLVEYILKMPKEAYLGIIIVCSSFFMIKNISHFLCNRGLTFPLLNPNFRADFAENESEDYDDYDGRMAEFSDDDLVDLTLDDDDDVSHLSDDTSDEEDESDDDELEVDSSDDESVAASESEMSEINIQLPDMEVMNRRSTTPSRFSKEMTPGDLQRVIEDEKERRMCVVCQDRYKSVLILPCRHMCLCVDCGNQIARSRARNRRVCPLCRTRIRTIMNVYI